MVGFCSGQGFILCEVRSDSIFISDDAQCWHELAHGLQTVLIAWNLLFPVKSLSPQQENVHFNVLFVFLCPLQGLVSPLNFFLQTCWQETCSVFNVTSATFISIRVLRDKILHNVLIHKSQQDAHVTEFISSDDCSTCFGYHYHPSSGAQNNCNYSIW